MTDRRRSRRAVLAMSGAVLSGLAGCTGLIQNGDSSESNDDGRDGTVTETPTEDTRTPRSGSDDDTPTPLEDSDENEDSTDENGTGDSVSEDSYVWHYEYSGSVDAIVEDLVLARQSFTNETDGGIVALDVETGDRRWQYGKTDGLISIYTEPTVEDAVYLGQGDDQLGGGTGKLMAVEFDGTERWSLETGTIYQTPVVADGTVYAGSDDGTVRAVDAERGTLRWATDDVPWKFAHQSTGPVVVGADDVVYVAVSTLVGLDPDDGTIRWEYGNTVENYVSDLSVSDGVAYVALEERGVSAVEAGEERWHTRLSGSFRIRGVHDGKVLVAASTGEDQAALHALDTDTGTRQWSIEGLRGTLLPMAVGSDRIYVDEGRLVAYGLGDGTAAWETTVDEDIGIVSVHEQDGEDSIYFTDDETLYRSTATGDIAHSLRLPGVSSLVVEESVFAGAANGIYRVDIE